MKPLLYQWTVNGAWQRGRKAIVDGGTYHTRGVIDDCTYHLMETVPPHELTFVRADELEVAPAREEEVPEPGWKQEILSAVQLKNT
jgi:hypothetical protein